MFGGYKIAVLCITKAGEEETVKLIKQLNDSLVQYGYRLFVYATCTDLYWNYLSEDGEKTVFELIDYDIADAVIIADELLKNKKSVEMIVNNARIHNIQLISYGGHHDNAINIGFDYSEGFEQVVRHITDVHNCRRVHFMAGIKNNEFSEQRRRCLEKVLKEKEIPFSEENVSYGDFWTDPAMAAAEEIIRKGDIPEAIVCANDVMAMAACKVFKNHGYKIPEDILITGFDGLNDLDFFSPSITTCRYSYEHLSSKICDLLCRAEKGENVNGDYLVDLEFIPGESCGCKKTVRPNAAEILTEMGDRLNRFINEGNTIYEYLPNIYLCDTIEQVFFEIRKMNFYGMFCFLNSECTDEKVNPLDIPEGSSFSDTMCWLFRYDGDDFRPCDFNRSDIIPDAEFLLNLKNPIVFNSLYFRNVPLGYICSFFEPYAMHYRRINQMVNSLNISLGGFRNMRYQKYLTDRIDEMARNDMMTGLLNRKGFSYQFDKMCSDCSGKVAIISADLDGLKYINDNFGHVEGDNAIITAARALKACCPEDAICARFGGDEFVAVTKDIASAGVFRNKVNDYVNAYNRISDKPYEVSVSVGVYIQDCCDDLCFEHMLKEADRKMYIDKSGKKTRNGKA